MAQRVIVAMSGGVDSSVAAALLHEEGYEVLGVTLELWGKDACTASGTRLCCSVRDALDARAVARRLGIRHETLERAAAFRTHVIDYFVGAYRDGLTPNPCIACNDHMKFGSLLAFAKERDAALVATGHYARSGYDRDRGRHVLRRALSADKDQSYVLFNLSQEQLAWARFPLGTLTKPEVRGIARALGLPTAGKPDSQDVCFIRDRNKNGFLQRALGRTDPTGPITDRSGTVLGEHQGLLGYTIGQREGIGLAVGKPLYVIEIDRHANRLVVGSRDELLRGAFHVDRVSWLSIGPPEAPVRAEVKIRSRHVPAPARIIPRRDGAAHVLLDEPQSAVTPGQAAVFYDRDLLLGGGWIAPDA